MAQRSLVIDASIVVKWFSAEGEDNVARALEIMDGHVDGELLLTAPDLLYYEVANALVHKKALTDEEVRLALRDTFALGLQTSVVDVDLMTLSIEMARKAAITVYDACYAALAHQRKCPLVTANPRHQAQVLNCEVIPLENWRG